MRTLKLFLILLLLLLLRGGANAQGVQFTLTPLSATSPQGGTVAFQATLKNATQADIYINQVYITFDDTSLITADPTPFYILFTGKLAAGKSLASNPIFDATSDLLLTSGTHHGTISVLGGSDSNALDNIAQQDFQIVDVYDTTPPITTITGGPADSGVICASNTAFTFTGTDNLSPTANLRYQYQLDSLPLVGLVSSTTASFVNLTEGLHKFSVAAVDEAGNTAQTVTRYFYVSLTPTAISSLIAAPRDYNAAITWNTDRAATSLVEYGLTASYGSSSPMNSGLNGAHFVALTGLTPRTNYHYRVHSSDGCRETVSADQTFTTNDILKPNIVVTSFTFPASVKPNDTVSVSWNVFNNGPGDSALPWTDAVYFSTKNTLDGSANLLGRFGPNGPLPEFGDYTRTQQIKMPLNPAGNYYLIVKTDVDNALAETSKDDNVLALPINYVKVDNLIATPDQIPLALNPGVAIQGTVTLGNLSPASLTGIKATIEGASPNLSIQITPPASLGTLQSAVAQYTVLAADESVLTNAPKIHFVTNEKEEAFATLNLTVIPRRPQLTVTPASFMASMLRPPDASTASMSDPKYRALTEVVINNTGSVPSDPLTIGLPDNTPWLTLVTPQVIAPIPPGGQARIALSARPGVTQTLGHYTGTIALFSTSANLTIPYDFNCVSGAFGTLSLVAQDEYSFFATPPTYVSNANVVLTDPQTGAVVAQGTTDANGVFIQPNLPENYYNLTVSADNHETSRSTVQILANDTPIARPFLSRNLVTYNWSVIPVDTPDHYVVTLDATFETNVPAPVVTVSPAYIDLRTLAFDSNGKSVINFVITNHGLVAANMASLIPQNTLIGYNITAAMQNLGNLPPLSTVIVPVTFSPSGKRAGTDCQVAITLTYSYVCGVPVIKSVSSIITGGAACGGLGGIPPGGGGGGGGAISSSPTATQTNFCDPCVQETLKQILLCTIGCIPGLNVIVTCPPAIYSCVTSDTAGAAIVNCTSAGLTCASKLFEVGCVLGLIGCADSILKACNGGMGILSADITNQYLRLSGQRLLTVVDAYAYFFGDRKWFLTSANEMLVSENWTNAFQAAMAPGSDQGGRISANERAALLNLPLPSQLTALDANKAIDRWNRTLDYYAAGILNSADVPAGQSPDFIAHDQIVAKWKAAVDAVGASQSDGFIDPVDAIQQTIQQIKSQILMQKDGICAQVKIRLDQDVTLTRTSFKATLELIDAPQNTQLQNVTVTLNIQDSSFNPVPADTFGVVGPTLTNIGNVSGTGVVNPGATATAQWLLTPTRSAAPLLDTTYYVGGTLSYTQNGTPITIALFPTSIRVKPDPFLQFHYFWQHDVYSDDPFTPQIEPAEPYALGLIVLNGGAGTARNLQITSSQPKIVENEKGLLIDFKIIGSQVNTQAVTPSLMVNLGDVGGGQSSVATWLMTSSLAGQFVDYSASFKHVDDLGSPRTSLLDSVKIDALEHVVRVDVPASADDARPDFLAVLAPDLVYKLYQSDGSDAANGTPVTPHLTDAVIDAPVTVSHLIAHLTVPHIGSGWVFIRTDDPAANSNYVLLRVIRSDGRQIRLNDNAWTTSRLIHLKGQAPTPQNRLYLFDKDSTGSYTLVYGPAAPVNVAPGGAKLLADGSQVILSGVVVTANLANEMYVEAQDRSAGIRVITNTAPEGTLANVAGKIFTDANGERYVDAFSLTNIGSATIAPLGLTTRSYYGGDNQYSSVSGVGQVGVTGGVGLNPIGLLTKTLGLVTAANRMAETFQMTDGFGKTVKVALPNGVAVPAVNSFVGVTGVASLEAAGGGHAPTLKTRRAADLDPDPGKTLHFVFTTPDGLLHPGLNGISLPGIPLNPSPPALLNNFDPGDGSGLQGRLMRFDAGTQNNVIWDAGIGFAAFGNLLLGDGYQLALRNGEKTAVQFPGFLANFADAYISLPKFGVTLLGHPFSYPVNWADALVTNGVKTVSLADAANVEFPPWLQRSTADYYDGAGMLTQHLGLPSDNPNSTQLTPWIGYYVFSGLDNLALIVPATTRPNLSGAISLQGIPNIGATAVPVGPVTFQFRPTDGSATTTQLITLNADGSFLLTDLPAKRYTLWIKGVKWLARAIPIDLTGRGVSGLNVTLQTGDANNDNSVDPTDFGILVGAYNSSVNAPGSGYDSAADFNCDGSVDATDFGLFVGNYNTVGDN